jgi:predicted ATPase
LMILASFTAQNFRQFTRLEIPRLARVNLFVGRNNAGKSALLEAIEVYVSNASAPTLINLVSAREETWGGSILSSPEPPANEVFRHLFKGHNLPPLDGKGFVVGPLGDTKNQLQVTIAAYLTLEKDGGFQRTRVDPTQYMELQDEAAELALDLVAIESGRTRRILGLNRTRTYGALNRSDVEPRAPVQVVPTKSMPPSKVAALWDIIGLTDLSYEVIEGLKLIEPSILDIAFVKATGQYFKAEDREPRVPLARLEGQNGPLPLRSMGDGITRLFHITLALVNARNGVLLVDEFENGLHWSVQEKVWRTVFQLADRLNVQVFATTHSRDCVQAFQAAWNDRQSEGAYYRMEADSRGEVRAREYSLDTLADSIATDVETR